VLSLEGDVGNKKPASPQISATREIIKFTPVNLSQKTSAATWEGTTAMSTDACVLWVQPPIAPPRASDEPAHQGEITGMEDLLLEGFIEGLVQLDERKLTVGASAKVDGG